MDVTQVTDEIKKIPLFKDMVWYEPNKSSHYGFIKTEPKTFKDEQKDTIVLSSKYDLFVAQMYGDSEDKSFFYLIFFCEGAKRKYRHRTSSTFEYNKIYASGKSVDEIISDLESKLIGYSL